MQNYPGIKGKTIFCPVIEVTHPRHFTFLSKNNQKIFVRIRTIFSRLATHQTFSR